MHNIVGDHVKEYIKETPEMRKFFERLVNANKKLFLVTNSPFPFV
jgi:FMN phosphatase YigB (HAD superfamily)